MTTVLVYAAAVSVILAIVLAVARDVPMLHLLMPPDVAFNNLVFGNLIFALQLTIVLARVRNW
jgi:hypothetical protein